MSVVRPITRAVTRAVTRTVMPEQGAGYVIANSLRLTAANSAYLERNFTQLGNQKTYTLATWVKRASIGSFQTVFLAGVSSPSYDGFRFTDLNKLQYFTQGAGLANLSTTDTISSTTEWVHITLAVDTTQAVAADRVKLWVGNTQYTVTGIFPTLDAARIFNTVTNHRIGTTFAGTALLDALIAEPKFIDGFAHDPSEFIDGEGNPIDYAGSYGNNGFKLEFLDNANIGLDTSGNENNWTPVNLSASDVKTDTPTNPA